MEDKLPVQWTKRIRPYTSLGTIIIVIVYSLIALIDKLFNLPALEKILSSDNILTISVVLILILVNTIVNQEILKDLVNEKERGLKVSISERWNDNRTYKNISDAKYSVKLFTTWHVSVSEWLSSLEEACKKTNENINFDIYMLDPDSELAGYRYREVFWNLENDNTDINDLTTKARKTNYNAINFIEKVVQNRSVPSNLAIKSFTYDLLPKIWLCIIDETKYIYAWFPNNSKVQTNVTFYIDKLEAGSDELKIIQHLDYYADGIIKNSKAI